MTRFMPQACTGPECPHCGCRDSRVIRRAPGTGRIIGPQGAVVATGVSWHGGNKARCGHCGATFSFPDEQPEEVPAAPQQDEPPANPSVSRRIVPQVKCEKCGTRMRVTRTKNTTDRMSIIRYYKCSQCGSTSKATAPAS